LHRDANTGILHGGGRLDDPTAFRFMIGADALAAAIGDGAGRRPSSPGDRSREHLVARRKIDRWPVVVGSGVSIAVWSAQVSG